MTIPSVLERLVFEISEFADKDFCNRVIDRANAIGFEPATITSENGTLVAPEIRNNDRVIFDDVAFAEEVWLRVSSHFRKPFKGLTATGINERFRVYRYVAGQFFDWHQDGEFQKTDGSVSKFTMMIYLNDVVDGGGTSFADVFSPYVFTDFTIEPAVGKALMFHHPLSHRGDSINSGVKYILRTDVMFRAKI
ncbi:2OG-Fe(II) oxygenase [Epibacterium ulvae]|uniref:2OG-Fe(II) oxygenase n=1 Tax=Epibacterium ulvae TaxID=1156985 RepID=UPI001BFCA3B9|nr:2OG-Fe(II) oxygenase [Epibacterium ulvae]MBT8154732.1 2OG-Fe(II) oxygenase [Epibacterium ulvae]